ncbi:hypothetical protein PGT21_002925 [Puccinia graminis f. sp. tritici]|uniref:Uncharacterized protein n=1 Tax=Puccinia graminis f. sp. tritici TaxID=56615 RepID=A0A5B0LWK8_PUCGR|nr:hypothetical protein PGT21_002925 [Puccinia graminis f. sp. tritici]
MPSWGFKLESAVPLSLLLPPLDQPLDFSDSNPVVSTIFPTIFPAISPNSPTTRALVLYVYPPVSTILLPRLDCPPINRLPIIHPAIGLSIDDLPDFLLDDRIFKLGGQWGPPGKTRLGRIFGFCPPAVYKSCFVPPSLTSSPALHSSTTSSRLHTFYFKKPPPTPYFPKMVTTRSSKTQAANDKTPVCLSQAVLAGPATSPTELHANKFMVSGPVCPFTPVNSPETKVPVPIHPSTVAPESSHASEHVDPHLVQEGINFYPLQSRWSPAFTPSVGNFPPGLRSPEFVNPSSTDGNSDSESGSSHSSVSDGFSSGSESKSSAPASAPPSIPNSSAFPSPSSSDLRSVPPSEVFYANRPRPQPVATGSGNSYDDPMVVNDDSASDSGPDSVPFGPTTEWGNTQPAAPQGNTVNPDPSAREMMAFDYRAIRDQLVGSNPLPIVFNSIKTFNGFSPLTAKFSWPPTAAIPKL